MLLPASGSGHGDVLAVVCVRASVLAFAFFAHACARARAHTPVRVGGCGGLGAHGAVHAAVRVCVCVCVRACVCVFACGCA